MNASQAELFPVAALSGQANRKICVSFYGISYEIMDPPLSWRAPLPDYLVCLVCADQVTVLAPNAASAVPFGRCACSAAFVEPASIEDYGLLELKFPLSDSDKALGERFRRELTRLGVPK